jgi:hypothetical protein
LVTGTLLVVLGGAALVAGAGAESGGSEGFVAAAAASGTRVTYTVPNFAAIETVVDAGGPVAQAVLDSVGTSRSFGSLPYPGDTVIALPGLISAGSGESFPVGYPAHAAAEHPAVPKAEVADPAGGYQLAASAAADGSDARARAGTRDGTEPRSEAASEASVVRGDDGIVRSRARSVIEGLAFGDGVLRIHRVVSEATTERAPGQDPKTSSRLLIEGASVNGTGVTFTPEGVEPLGSHVPLPIGPATAQLNEALSSAGLTVEVVRGTPVGGGVQSDLLQITSAYPSAAPGLPAGTVVFRFGGVTTSVVAGAGTLPPLPAAPAPGSVVPTPDSPGEGGDSSDPRQPVGPSTPEPDRTDPASVRPGPVQDGSPSSGRGEDGLDLPPGTSGGNGQAAIDPSGSARQEASAATPLTARAIGRWERFGSSKLPYLALASGALLLLAGTRLVGGRDKEAWWIS